MPNFDPARAYWKLESSCWSRESEGGGKPQISALGVLLTLVFQPYICQGGTGFLLQGPPAFHPAFWMSLPKADQTLS